MPHSIQELIQGNSEWVDEMNEKPLYDFLIEK
jgi:hypothetical protein